MAEAHERTTGEKAAVWVVVVIGITLMWWSETYRTVPIQVSVGELIRNPFAYEQKLVSLRGRIALTMSDECVLTDQCGEGEKFVFVKADDEDEIEALVSGQEEVEIIGMVEIRQGHAVIKAERVDRFCSRSSSTSGIFFAKKISSV